MHSFKLSLGQRAEHTIAITPEDVISWGANDRGQCGQGERSETDWVKPRSLKPLQQADVSQVVCGRTHTLCVTTTSMVSQKKNVSVICEEGWMPLLVMSAACVLLRVRDILAEGGVTVLKPGGTGD